jgi:hypothetical protein
VPRHRLEIDAADDRTRTAQTIGDRAGEIERCVGNERRIEIATDGAEQRRIVLLALARVGAGLEVLIGDDLRAEFLRRAGEGCGHRRVGGRGAFEHQKAAPFARDDELREPVHELGAARIDMDEFGRAQIAAQRILWLRDVEQKSVAATHGFGERLEALRRRVDQEEMRAGIERRAHRRRDLGCRFHSDPLQAEVGLQHAREWSGIVEADFGAGKRVRAGLEDDALVGAHRRVARVVFDLDEGDIDLLLCRRLVLRRSGGYRTNKREQEKKCERQTVPLRFAKSG